MVEILLTWTAIRRGEVEGCVVRIQLCCFYTRLENLAAVLLKIHV